MKKNILVIFSLFLFIVYLPGQKSITVYVDKPDGTNVAGKMVYLLALPPCQCKQTVTEEGVTIKTCELNLATTAADSPNPATTDKLGKAVFKGAPAKTNLIAAIDPSCTGTDCLMDSDCSWKITDAETIMTNSKGGFMKGEVAGKIKLTDTIALPPSELRVIENNFIKAIAKNNSIRQESPFNITLYPSPSEFLLHFNTKLNEQPVHINIFNILGQQVYSANHLLVPGINTFNVASYTPGIYKLMITGDKIKLNGTFVKR